MNIGGSGNNENVVFNFEWGIIPHISWGFRTQNSYTDGWLYFCALRLLLPVAVVKFAATFPFLLFSIFLDECDSNKFSHTLHTLIRFAYIKLVFKNEADVILMYCDQEHRTSLTYSDIIHSCSQLFKTALRQEQRTALRKESLISTSLITSIHNTTGYLLLYSRIYICG